MKDIVNLCHENKIVLMADEVYQENIYFTSYYYSFKLLVFWSEMLRKKDWKMETIPYYKWLLFISLSTNMIIKYLLTFLELNWIIDEGNKTPFTSFKKVVYDMGLIDEFQLVSFHSTSKGFFIFSFFNLSERSISYHDLKSIINFQISSQ